MRPVAILGRLSWTAQSALTSSLDATAGWLGLLDRVIRADPLIAEARRRTGFGKFGDEGFRAGLETLLAACASEACPSVIGRTTIRWDAVRLLSNLLLLQAEETRQPGIGGEPIEGPIFITGLPRSGTTFLHKLLMEDPANDAPRVWQAIHPYPSRVGADPAACIASVNRQLRTFAHLAPDFRSMHPIDATSPQECSEITAHVFASLRFDTTYHVPSYRRWLDQRGHLEAYAFHQRFLRHLQHRAGRPLRWVLKCPDHVFALDAISTIYPSAKMVFVHRDPLKVLPSVTRLTEVLRRPFTRRIDRIEIGRQESDRWLEGTSRMIAASKTDPFTTPIAHVRYTDLVGDPLGTVQTLYTALGLTLSDDANAQMRRSIAAEPKGGYGINRYHVADYGLDLAVERARFAAYGQHFGIEPEPDSAEVSAEQQRRWLPRAGWRRAVGP